MRFPIFPLELLIASLLLSLGGLMIYGQTVPGQNKEVNLVDHEGILNQLAPNDVFPHSLALKPAEKTLAIRLLVAVKRDETGWHRQLAVYLLASLGHDYESNREELLRVWRKDGDDETMELLIGLYDQGHKEFLKPLLAGYNGWNAAASEGLGTFYSEQLEMNPQVFLTALAIFPPRRQLYLCTAAGETDGGGMNSKAERKVLANLKKIGGDLANRCARGVREGNRSGEEADQEEQREIRKEAQDKQKKK